MDDEEVLSFGVVSLTNHQDKEGGVRLENTLED